jgi:hypothetical protein
MIIENLNSHTMAMKLTAVLRRCSFPSLSETFFHDTFEYFQFSGNFLYPLPEKVDRTDLLLECILVCFSERVQFVQ